MSLTPAQIDTIVANTLAAHARCLNAQAYSDEEISKKNVELDKLDASLKYWNAQALNNESSGINVRGATPVG